MLLREVEVKALALERLRALIGSERMGAFEALAAKARVALDHRTVWNISSTATGGGVAEMLQILLAYARGAGIETRWCVINADQRFFEITKRIHNNLYGAPGDGGPLGAAERGDYEATLRRHVDDVRSLVRPDDIVILHDPQPAGLAEAVRTAGARLVWRCHIGSDGPNEYTERGWQFVRAYVEGADGFVFSCRHFAPDWIPRERLAVIAPSIDPFSSKNVDIEPDVVLQLLRYVGLLRGDGQDSGATFVRRDGTSDRVRRTVELFDTGPPPPAEAPLVVQISRWDALKDMAGVQEAFATYIADNSDAHLILAGPQPSGVADDPEANDVLQECLARWRALPEAARQKTHIACIPMDDTDENATIVNALQRHASVVTQKSLAEGFGLTVAEAMWKSRAVVATAIGGMTDQVVDGETGLLVGNGVDLKQFANAVQALLDDPGRRARMGANARRRAVEHFLGDRHLEQWAQLFALMDGED
jgi:trehalose synthase